MPDFTSAMVAMIGLGVGIDYALFIVTRYREALHAGLDASRTAIAEAIDTSGRAVIFAGTTVIISLLGLSLMGLAFVTGVAIASAIGVLMMVIASLTLLPALLGWVGARIDNTTRAALIAVAVIVVVGSSSASSPAHPAAVLARSRRARHRCSSSPAIVVQARRCARSSRTAPRSRAEQRFWYRWSRDIQHRPWPDARRRAS